MTVLALDLSTKTGVAFLDVENGKAKLISIHKVELPKTILEFGRYPECYLKMADFIAAGVIELVEKLKPDQIVIEETNLGSFSRYSQKSLEMIHFAVLKKLRVYGILDKTFYVSSGEWRKTLNLRLSKQQKKANTDLSRAKSKAKKSGGKLDKKKLGIRGKLTKKHLAILWANEYFGLELKMKENDEADALALGTAFVMGAKICDGK